MSLITQVGTYLGYASSHAVNESSGGYPQLELQCEATHYYDEEVGDYVEVEDLELRAFLVLYGKNQKPIRNCEQVKKVFKWGGSFPELATMDLKDTRFLFRVKENPWNGDINYKVDWIDIDTASPTGQISSLDIKDLQALDIRYGIVSAGKKTDSKPKPTGSPKPPKASTKKTKEPEKSGPPSPAPATPPETKDEIPITGKTTRDGAWEAIADLVDPKTLSEEQLAIVWAKTIQDVHGGPDDDTLTENEWFKIQKIILDKHAKF